MTRAERIGGWLFRWRGLVPVPVFVAYVVLAVGPGVWLVPGVALVLADEALRLWAVAHIGPRSRTRGDDVGALVTSGPYRWSRNPLYVGNLGLWAGMGLLTGRPWLAFLTIPLAVHYALIVRWEEGRLRAIHGRAWEEWAGRVGRWFGGGGGGEAGKGDWGASIRSERWTLVALSVAAGVMMVRGL